jgi:hypothetical protein
MCGRPADEAIDPLFCSERLRIRDTTEGLERVASPDERRFRQNHVQFNRTLARMMRPNRGRPNGGLRDSHVLQHATKINTCKITDLDCDQASCRTEPRGKAERHCCRNALKQNDCHQGQKRSHGKHRPRNRSGNKMKSYHRYQAMPPRTLSRGYARMVIDELSGIR